MQKPQAFKLLFVVFLFINFHVSAQDYVWRRGTKLLNQPGSYGTLAFTSNLNDPGGREGSVTWKDAFGNFWLFGGFGPDQNGAFGLLNDLWKYDPVINQWTWINGNKTKDQKGIYVTQGIPDSGNKPGSRAGATGWVDPDGDLWLFGGYGLDAYTTTQGQLNDLWKYNVINDEWTWMSGRDSTSQPGNYGALGVSSPSNVPGARYASVSWTDNTGNLWLFGGYGYDGFSGIGFLNDVWKYNRVVNEWMWVKGNIGISQNGNYGVLGVPGSSTTPGARYFSSSWKDASGNFWLFGGDGFDAAGGFGSLNDLWKYNSINNEWTWYKGSTLFGQAGSYGNQGVPNSGNFPGARNTAMTWVDASGSFWLLGGFGLSSTTTSGYLNDLWKYNPLNNQWVWLKGINFVNQQSAYGTQEISSPLNRVGGRKGSAYWLDEASNLYVFGGNGYNDVTQGELNDMWKYINCQSSVKATSSNSSICAGETVTLSANTASTYVWNNGINNRNIVVKPTSTTSYTVEGIDNYACTYTATVTQYVKACLGINSSLTENTSHSIYPNPSHGVFTLNVIPANEAVKLVVYNLLGEKVFEHYATSEKEEINSTLAPGLYTYQIFISEDRSFSGKLLID